MPSPQNSHVLMIMNGPEDGRVFDILKESITIGASDDDDITIRSDPSLKETHAVIVRNNNQFKLTKNWPAQTPELLIQPGRCFTIGQTELLIKLKYQV